MLITPANLNALNTSLSLAYQKAYDTTAVWYPEIATEIPSGSTSNTYAWVEKMLKLRKWVGPRIAHNLKAQSYVLPNEPYEGTVEVDRDDIEDDNIGVYTAMIMPGLGEAVRKHPDQLVAQLIKDNTALAYDGLPLFDHAHLIGESGTYDNDFDLLLTADNFNTVWSAMVGYQGDDNLPLGVVPSVLYHAPQLKKKALEILNSTTIVQAVQNVAGTENVGAAAADNQMKGWCKPVMIEEWSDKPNMWVLADCRKPVKPIVYQVRRKATFVARDNPQDPKVFNERKFTYGTDYRGAVGITLPFLTARGHG